MPVVPSESHILASLEALHRPGEVVEIRMIDALLRKGSDARGVVAGYYADFSAAARDVVSQDWRQPAGVYHTLQVITPALLARCCNRLEVVGKRPTTSDKEVARLRWILIDIDPVRPAGISSSDEEQEAAFEVARAVSAGLAELGMTPLKAASGNGAHLLVETDLPPEEAPQVARFLQGLDAKYSTAAAKVDQTTFNPSRIGRLYGTFARKGDTIPGRPHRQARLILPDGGAHVASE